MASIGAVFNDKVLPPILTFVNTKPITALKNGMMFVMPLTIVGAVFLLLANFPIESFSGMAEEHRDQRCLSAGLYGNVQSAWRGCLYRHHLQLGA